MAVLVFRGLLGDDEDHSVIGNDPVFRQIGAESKTFKFRLEPEEAFETAILGHSGIVLDQGPLTVAALGWNPPERSVQFHLSLLTLSGDFVGLQVPKPSVDEFKVIEQQLMRLNTKSLTILMGDGLDHAMVCDKRIDLRTTSPSIASVQGKHLSLPEGDAENEFRRFVDDSVNLLAEQEFNIRRMDQGISPINLCWPWGQGERPRVSNRAIELGFPWKVLARSFALRGLAKLSGLRPQKLPEWESIDFAKLARDIQSDPRTLIIIDIPVVPGDDEEREAFLNRIANLGTLLIDPLLEWRRDSKGQLVFVATERVNEGIVGYCTKENERVHFPFDERSLVERKVQDLSLTSLLDSLD